MPGSISNLGCLFRPIIPPIRHGSTAGLPCHSCLAQSTETSFGAPCTCHQLLELPSISCHDSLCNLTRLIQRFGGSFPAQRVKTASSFFTTLAISFPVGSLGEEFGWRGVMAPYLNTLLDRKFGGSRFWKWTPAIQSLITGVFWAVCVGPNKTFDIPMIHLQFRFGMFLLSMSMVSVKASAIFGNF